MKQLLSSSYLFGGNAPFIEELYEQYLANPGAVPDEWREYFDQMQLMPDAAGSAGKDVAHAPVIQSFVQRGKAGELAGRAAPQIDVAHERLQVAALLLVTAYRIAGARWAT
ncbi:MAG: 2-oxoglutarate dehydrogenase E1 component, partial [Burkholderiales bacterium]